MQRFFRHTLTWVLSLAFSFAPMGASAQDTATPSQPASAAAAPATSGQISPDKSAEVKSAPVQDSEQKPSEQGDRRGGENQRPEDTRRFGQPGKSEEQVNREQEERQKRDDERTKRDEERMKKDDERRAKDEERFAKQKEREFSSMKKNFSRQAKGISQMRSKITRFEKTLTKCGAAMPKDILEALDAVDALKAKVDAAKDMDEFSGHMQDMEEHMQTIRESEGQFGMLDGLCNNMIPQAERMLKEMRKTKPLEKLIAKSGDLVDELNGLLNEYKTEVDKLEAVLGQVKQKASADAQDAMETLQSDFFGAMDTVFSKRGQIEAVAQSKKGIDMLTKQLEKLKKQRTKLAKKEGADVTALSGALDKLEEAIGEIAKVRKAKGDPEEMMEPFSDAFGALEDASEALQELGGGQSDFTRQFMKMMGGPQGGPGGPGGGPGQNMKMNFGIPSFSGMMSPGRGPGGPDMMSPGRGDDRGDRRDMRGEDRRDMMDRRDMGDRRGPPPGDEGFRDDRRDMGPPQNGDFRKEF